MEPLLYLNGNLGQSILAFGQKNSFIFSEGSKWTDLDEFIAKNKGSYIVGSFSYDLKNESENLHSLNESLVEFPLIYLFVPQCVIEVKGEEFTYLQGVEENYRVRRGH